MANKLALEEIIRIVERRLKGIDTSSLLSTTEFNIIAQRLLGDTLKATIKVQNTTPQVRKQLFSLAKQLEGEMAKIKKADALDTIKAEINSKRSNAKPRTIQSKLSISSRAALSNLRTLINTALHDAIRDRMGKGSSKSVLNYRTGRFANSARVTSILPKPRKNNFVVRYSYRLFPYQTFEPGFKQGSPRSRDPRLLISSAIRSLMVEAMKIRFNQIETVRNLNRF